MTSVLIMDWYGYSMFGRPKMPFGLSHAEDIVYARWRIKMFFKCFWKIYHTVGSVFLTINMVTRELCFILFWVCSVQFRWHVTCSLPRRKMKLKYCISDFVCDRIDVTTDKATDARTSKCMRILWCSNVYLERRCKNLYKRVWSKPNCCNFKYSNKWVRSRRTGSPTTLFHEPLKPNVSCGFIDDHQFNESLRPNVWYSE